MDTERGADAELRLVLVGKSGGGRSATGNTILGRKVFKSTSAAETATLRCQREQGTWQGMKLSVVDTPAMFDADNLYTEIMRREIMACIQLSCPGPHAFILVTQVGRFTARDAAAVKCVRDIFGTKCIRHMIVLFTCVEHLDGVPLQEYVRTSENRNLRDLIWRCRKRFCGFNNRAAGAERVRQVSELIVMVQKTLFQNSGRYYVNRLYLEPNLRVEHVRMFIEQNRKPSQSIIHILLVFFLPLWLAFCIGGHVLSFLRNVFFAAFEYFFS